MRSHWCERILSRSDTLLVSYSLALTPSHSLRSSLRHLDRVCLYLFQPQLRDYSHAYDLSRSERSKVHRLAVTMATDGQPLGRIGELLAVAGGSPELSVKSVLHDAVARVVATLRY